MCGSSPCFINLLYLSSVVWNTRIYTVDMLMLIQTTGTLLYRSTSHSLRVPYKAHDHKWNSDGPWRLVFLLLTNNWDHTLRTVKSWKLYTTRRPHLYMIASPGTEKLFEWFFKYRFWRCIAYCTLNLNLLVFKSNLIMLYRCNVMYRCK